MVDIGCWQVQGSFSGLGVMGAIAINLCGATAVVWWLLCSPVQLSVRGKVVLWVVAVIVYAIAAFEIRSRPWQTTA